MNVTEFFSTIIEEEKEKFNIGNKSLKAAVRSVVTFNNPKSVEKSQSSQKSTIYRKPTNRCAYLYKYGTINTGLITKHFRKLAKRKEVKNKMYSKKSICCLGGGPGTDVVGVFKALAVNPAFNARITEVSVLDICSEWENMFNNIISGLLDGKLKGVPETFINPKNFSHKFVEVDLLDSLPHDAIEIISNADIVCMTRFVSDILGDARSSNALKVLGNFIKLGALVLYIDMLNEKVFELTEDISQDTGLEIVLNPLHERFTRYCVSENEVYGCSPLFSGTFSIVGWHKTSVSTNTIFDDRYSTNNSDAESEESSVALEVYDSEDNSTALEVYDSEDNYTALDYYSEDNSNALDMLDSEGNDISSGMLDYEGNSNSLDVLDYESNGNSLDVLDYESNSNSVDILNYEGNATLDVLNSEGKDGIEALDSEGNCDGLEALDSEGNSDGLEVVDMEDTGALKVLDSDYNIDTLEELNLEDRGDALEKLNSGHKNNTSEILKSEDKESLNKHHSLVDSYTQTESNIFTQPDSGEKEDILVLMKAVSNLLNVVEQWKQKHTLRKCCCCH